MQIKLTKAELFNLNLKECETFYYKGKVEFCLNTKCRAYELNNLQTGSCGGISNCFNYNTHFCHYIANCYNCSFCICCYGLKTRKYCILNVQLTRAEFIKVALKFTLKALVDQERIKQ